MKRSTLAVGAALVGLAVVAAVYFSYSATESSANSVQVAVRLVEFSANRFWDPSNITVKQGQTVTLVVFNGDDEDSHTFAIDAINVSIGPVLPGASMRGTFVASTVGVFRFYDPLPPTITDPLRNEAGLLIVVSP